MEPLIVQAFADAARRGVTIDLWEKTEHGWVQVGSKYGYDIAGNQTSVSNQLAQNTVTTYTRTGTPASVTDPKGNVTTFGYDPLDRVNAVTAPGQGTTAYSYSTAGRLAVFG